MKNQELKRKRVVIDADNEKILESFEKHNTKAMLNKYQSKGIWDDISVDYDGDITLWKEL